MGNLLFANRIHLQWVDSTALVYPAPLPILAYFFSGLSGGPLCSVRLAQFDSGTVAQFSPENAYVDGINLDAFMTDAQPDFFQRSRLWRQIDEALSHAHSLGVFHGDLHPGNILIVGETVKVIDFGTSIFASNETDSERRETVTLISLNKRIFSTHEPSLDKILDIDLLNLNPVRVLSALSSYVDILFQWQQMSGGTRSDDWLITQMYHFSFDVLKVPVFSIELLLQELARRKFSINVQEHFIADCLMWANIFLEEPAVTRTGGHAIWHHSGDLNPQANKARLKEITPCLRDAFYKNGPLSG